MIERLVHMASKEPEQNPLSNGLLLCIGFHFSLANAPFSNQKNKFFINDEIFLEIACWNRAKKEHFLEEFFSIFHTVCFKSVSRCCLNLCRCNCSDSKWILLSQSRHWRIHSHLILHAGMLKAPLKWYGMN